ncbi:MAG: hypothetical protein RJA09_1178, partial [Pseudomonadota bacterium]
MPRPSLSRPLSTAAIAVAAVITAPLAA